MRKKFPNVGDIIIDHDKDDDILYVLKRTTVKVTNRTVGYYYSFRNITKNKNNWNTFSAEEITYKMKQGLWNIIWKKKNRISLEPET